MKGTSVNTPDTPIPALSSEQANNQPSPVPAPENAPQGEQEFFFLYEQADRQKEEAAMGAETQYVAPFQFSAPIPSPSLPLQTKTTPGAIPPGTLPYWKRKGAMSLIVVLIALLTLGVCVAILFAPQAPRPFKPMIAARPSQARIFPTTRASIMPQQGQMQPPQPQMTADQIPQTLPAGWQAAGLQTADALFANYTAGDLFTKHEENLDFRNMGTRAHHGGTMTAALFILTPNAKRLRFAQQDVRVVNNHLFDEVQTHQMMQVALNLQSHVVQFQMRGQQPFAWVDVGFQLWRSQITNANAPQQRVLGFDTDPATHQPQTHHLMVLLLRIPPQSQGPNAPAGGTGWLVSSYELDPPAGTLLIIPQQP